MNVGRSWVLVLGLTAAACGGGGAGGPLGKPVAEFPSRDALEDVAEGESTPLEPFNTVEVPRWDLDPANVPPAAAYPAETPWDELLASTAAKSGARLSPPLRCAANEVARFFAQHGAYPDDGLRVHLIRRCGSSLPQVGLQTVELVVPDNVPDAEIGKNLRAAAIKMFTQQARSANTEIGAGYARGSGRVAIVTLAAAPTASLDPFSPLIEGESVTLSGELPRDAERAIALVNYGPFGVRVCEPDRRIKRPRFSVTCPVLADDATTRIDIASSRRGQVLMHQNLEVLVWRNEQAGLSYEPVTHGEPTKADSPAAFRRAFVAKLNQVRANAKLGALTVENDQSQLSDRLTPHFFNASATGDSSRTDLIALGLLAGWDVGGMIRDGGIFTGSLYGSRSPERFLSYALESPFGRQVLLDPDMSRAAVGTSLLSPSGIATIVTTYAFFENESHDADEDAVFAELVKLRVARGLPAPTRAKRGDALTRALGKIATNTVGTSDALQEALHQISQERSQSMSGFTIETHDLTSLELADELLRNAPLEVTIGVTHYKPEDAAWGQYVVVFVTDAAGPNVRTARTEPSKAAPGAGIFAARKQTPRAN